MAVKATSSDSAKSTREADHTTHRQRCFVNFSVCIVGAFYALQHLNREESYVCRITKSSPAYPVKTSLFKSAEDAYSIGFLQEVPNLDNIYDLVLLNEVLNEKGLDKIQ